MNKLLIIGSASVHITNFINIIDSAFDEIILITDGDFKDDRLSKIYVVEPQTLNPIKAFNIIGNIRKIIKDEQPNIVHIHQVTRLAYFAIKAIKGKIPSVVTAWGSDILLMPQKNFIYNHLVKYVLKKASYITGDSDDMIEKMKQLTLKNKNLKNILFGIDPIPYNLLQKQNIIFSNRQLKPLYNIDKIIADFAIFHKKHSDWQLVIAGVGELSEELKNQVKALGLEKNVSFVGWLKNEQNREYYSKSRIYISIPDSDGTAVSLLEAMSAGCIPIVSDLPVSKQWIRDDKNGIIRNENDNCFERAIEVDGTKVAENNNQIINEKATTNVAKKQFIQIYHQLLNQA